MSRYTLHGVGRLLGMALTQPVLVEHLHDALGSYTQRWMCAPPHRGVQYIVVQEEWNADCSVRTIYTIELCSSPA
jgi:hypothetical protein